MSYAIRSSRKSDADADIVFDWIAERSPDGARRWLEAFEAAIDKLKTQADTCNLAPERSDLGIELRQLMFRTRRGRPYRLLFVIRENTVHLAAVRSAGQQDVAWRDIELPD